MATSRKRSTSKSSSARRRRTSSSKRRMTSAKKGAKRATATKRVRRTSTGPKKVLKPTKSKWYSVLTFSVVILGLAVAGVLSMNPDMLERLQASLVAQEGTTESSDVVAPAAAEPSEGILITWKDGGDNEVKLKDIFRTVFPDTSVEEVHYLSAEGQDLVQRFGVREVPSIHFEQSAFEAETLAEVVKDLFELNNGYYGLNVSLVNPSNQLHIAGPITHELATTVGSETAPLSVNIYSDPKCQHCRVLEQNTMESFIQLADEGIAQLHFVELPQTSEAQFHSVALHCVGTLSNDNYLDFRSKLFRRANLTNAFTKRELERLDIDYDNDCDEAETRRMFRLQIRDADADGITGVPTIYMSRTGESTSVRITGAKEFSEYELVFDDLMGKELENEEAEGVDDDTSGADL